MINNTLIDNNKCKENPVLKLQPVTWRHKDGRHPQLAAICISSAVLNINCFCFMVVACFIDLAMMSP